MDADKTAVSYKVPFWDDDYFRSRLVVIMVYNSINIVKTVEWHTVS